MFFNAHWINQTHQESSKNIIVRKEEAREAHKARENMKRSLRMRNWEYNLPIFRIIREIDDVLTIYINLCIITKLYLNTLWFGELHMILD